ncbi:hypothetical protein ACN38_g4901 [Penicillium nordicum]|uniref:Uncharacterized protein n=1 Tax=Penicillium nordicum TaxID=229535 RepID=A0A0M8P2P0_9EURO|nr:hypothetical protein ACN38_g4901 [Penicillium nordicum]
MGSGSSFFNSVKQASSRDTTFESGDRVNSAYPSYLSRCCFAERGHIAWYQRSKKTVPEPPQPHINSPYIYDNNDAYILDFLYHFLAFPFRFSAQTLPLFAQCPPV